MRISTLLHILTLATLLGGAFATLAPVAQAQGAASVTVTMTQLSDPIKPLQAPASISGTVKFDGRTDNYATLIGIPVTLKVSKAPAWANAIVSPATVVIPLPPQQNQVASGSAAFTVSVTASDLAPAFQADQIEITATATNGGAPGSTTGSGATTITADYFSLLDAQLTETVKIDRPQTAVVFPLKITNLGNANTKVSFAIQDKPENLQVPVPSAVTLQSKQTGGSTITAEVPLTVQTPYHNGYLNEVGVVSYKFTSAYALDPKKIGDSGTVSVVITTRGFYVPGPEPILVVGLVALSALAVRLVRKN